MPSLHRMHLHPTLVLGIKLLSPSTHLLVRDMDGNSHHPPPNPDISRSGSGRISGRSLKRKEDWMRFMHTSRKKLRFCMTYTAACK